MNNFVFECINAISSISSISSCCFFLLAKIRMIKGKSSDPRPLMAMFIKAKFPNELLNDLLLANLVNHDPTIKNAKHLLYRFLG